jgi:hypothetical protein
MRLTTPRVLLALLLSLGGASVARAEGGATDAKPLIAKAIEARGGKANIEKFKAQTAKFKGTLTIMGNDLTMTGTTKVQSPDKVRVEANMAAGGQDMKFAQIFNGTKGWQGLNGEFQELDKDALHEASEEQYVNQITDLVGLDNKDLKVQLLGESKVDDKPAVGLRVSSPGHRDISLYLDKNSGLVLKTETKGKDPMAGNEYKSETYYSDYRKTGALMLPYKMKVLRDGAPFMTMEVSDITLAEKLDDKTFEKP